MTTERFDGFARSYNAIYSQSVTASGDSLEYFVEYKLGCLRRLRAPAHEPILDYGCGTGNVTAALMREFGEVHGYDPSQESLRVARERVPGATFHAEIGAVESSRFATAVVGGVLHHVPREERLGVLRSVLEKLRPGGRLFVFEHNPLNPVTRHVVRACPFDDDAELLFPWQARRLVQAAGFRDVELTYIVFFPRLLGFLRPLEPRLGWLPLGAQLLVTGKR